MMNPNPLAHLAHRPLAILPSAVQAFALRFTEALQPDASRMVGQRTQGAPIASKATWRSSAS